MAVRASSLGNEAPRDKNRFVGSHRRVEPFRSSEPVEHDLRAGRAAAVSPKRVGQRPRSLADSGAVITL